MGRPEVLHFLVVAVVGVQGGKQRGYNQCRQIVLPQPMNLCVFAILPEDGENHTSPGKLVDGGPT